MTHLGYGEPQSPCRLRSSAHLYSKLQLVSALLIHVGAGGKVSDEADTPSPSRTADHSQREAGARRRVKIAAVESVSQWERRRPVGRTPASTPGRSHVTTWHAASAARRRLWVTAARPPHPASTCSCRSSSPPQHHSALTSTAAHRRHTDGPAARAINPSSRHLPPSRQRLETFYSSASFDCGSPLSPAAATIAPTL